MNSETKDLLRRQIADFRHSVVAELCNCYLSFAEKQRLIRDKAERLYTIPGSKKSRISVDTIRNWISRYTRQGLDGLYPKLREDRGRPRSFTDAEAAAIQKMLEDKPELTASTIIEMLRKKGVITSRISSSSLSRFIRAHALTGKDRKREHSDSDRRRYSFDSPLACVQSDAMHGFPVPDGKGKKRKAILIAFLDDYSRRILYGRFHFSEKAIHFEDGIRHIVKAHGKIGKLYTDNGSTFVSHETKRIVDTLGIYLIHSRPYKPQGRGKVERFFRTVRQSFLRPLEQDSIQNLEHLNHLFTTWLETEYHRQPHSSLGVTPLDAWLSKTDSIKHYDNVIDIDRNFLHQLSRKVYTDAVVSVDGSLFEVPSILIGKTISVLFDPHPPIRKIEIYWNGTHYGEARPLDLYANTRVKRGQSTKEIELTPDTSQDQEQTELPFSGGLL